MLETDARKVRAGNYDLVPPDDFQRLERDVERHRAVCERDGVFSAGPGRELPFELPAFIPSPVIDPVGKEHRADRIRLFIGKTRPRVKWGI